PKWFSSKALKDDYCRYYRPTQSLFLLSLSCLQYTHITLKPSYAMYYLDLVMKFFSQFRKHFYSTMYALSLLNYYAVNVFMIVFF
ncbi:Os05g0148000, partial [Oryza sativa Japonica Group]